MDFRGEQTTTCVPKAPSLLFWRIKFCRTVLPIHLYTIHGLFHVPLAELNNCNRPESILKKIFLHTYKTFYYEKRKYI